MPRPGIARIASHQPPPRLARTALAPLLGIQGRLAQQHHELRQIAVIGEVVEVVVAALREPRVQPLAVLAHTPLQQQLKLDSQRATRQQFAHAGFGTLTLDFHGAVTAHVPSL